MEGDGGDAGDEGMVSGEGNKKLEVGCWSSSDEAIKLEEEEEPQGGGEVCKER